VTVSVPYHQFIRERNVKPFLFPLRQVLGQNDALPPLAVDHDEFDAVEIDGLGVSGLAPVEARSFRHVQVRGHLVHLDDGCGSSVATGGSYDGRAAVKRTAIGKRANLFIYSPYQGLRKSLMRMRRTVTDSASIGIFAGLYQEHSWAKWNPLP